jgi:protein involved in polysaccharide export with SLBB domain
MCTRFPRLLAASGINRWPLAVLLLAHPAAAQDGATRIRSGDVLTIVVADQPAITNRYLVEPDGVVTVPLVGAVRVGGLTEEQVTVELRRRFAEFLTNPQPRVTINRARRVFVFGAVKTPGALEMSGDMTVLEALSRSGYSGTSQVMVVRPKDSHGPALIDDPTAEVMKVNLREIEKDLQSGALSKNVLLRDGDTIYVPDGDPNEIYVSGEVRKPGAYSIPNGTTVLQAVSLAGGVTEQAALGRVQIVRLIDGEQKSTRAKLEDAVEPGATVLVPEKIPFPAVRFGPETESDPAKQKGLIHVGQALSLRPVAAIRRIGVDSNVFNTAGDTVNDFTVVAGPELEAVLDLRRVRLRGLGAVDYVYFRRFQNERSVNSSGGLNAEVLLSKRLRLVFGGTTTNTRDRLNDEVDGRVRRYEHDFNAAVQMQVIRRLDVEVRGRDFDRRFADAATFLGVNVQETLSERVRSATATVRLAVTQLTSLVVSGTTATHRFSLFPQKDADATEGSVGALFKPGALLSGDAHIGYLRYLGLDPTAPVVRGAIGNAELFFQPKERTRFGLIGERTTGSSYQPFFPYAIIDRLGGSLQQGIFRRFDVRVETYRERYHYARFRTPDEPVSPVGDSETTQRYESELGVRFGAMRVGFDAMYVQRLSTVLPRRDYNALRLMANISVGALQVHGQ